MRQGDKGQQRRADHRHEDAEIEEERARQVDFAEQGQRQDRRVAGQEGIAEEDGAEPGQAGDDETVGDPPVGAQGEVRFDPEGAGQHVLDDDRHGEDQAGDETAAGRVVPAQEEVGSDDDHERQQEAQIDAGDQQVAPIRLLGGCLPPDRVGVVGLLRRQFEALGGGAEAAQQRIDGQGDDRRTVISPIVSKPRKSTSRTLTALLPPPSGRARRRKKSPMLCGAGRVSTA